MIEILIYVGGVYCLGFVAFHLMFWKTLKWKQDLASLSEINQAVVPVLNISLILFFLIMAYVSLFHVSELVQTSLGHTLLLAFALFWFLRAIQQVVFFGIKKASSIGDLIGFLIGAALYLIPFLIVV